MPTKIQLPPLKSFEEVWAIVQENAEGMKEIRAIQQKTAESTEKHDKEIEEIRAILRETAESMKDTDERMKETDERMKENAESGKETDRRLKETERMIKENGRLIRENSKQMGLVQNKLGEVVEHIVMPNISEKFKLLKYNFGKPRRNVKFYDKKLGLIAEADIVMADDDGNLMLGEVKTTLKKEDVDRHVKRLEAVRNAGYLPADDNRALMGFMAGAIVSEEVKEYAHKNGFFVAVQSGDTMKLDVPEGFVPKTW
ncbi:MAG: hypothetical protein LBJ86_07415 [Spirochaetaceae bacterium]|jgi:hypothetical protein|nr:hypothetical protein [Spirochaetaceae bacterium]